MNNPRASFAILGLAGLLALGGCGDGLVVVLRNDAGTPLADVVVHYTGGVADVAALAPGERARRPLRPTGETALAVDYVLAGHPRHCELDVYLEPGYDATVEVALAADGCTLLSWP